MAKAKKIRPQVGHQVRILDPRFVTRVGYPKGIEDYVALLTGNPEVNRALQIMFTAAEATIGQTDFFSSLGTGIQNLAVGGSQDKILSELAYHLAKMDGFGGRTRSVHLSDPIEAVLGKQFMVCDVHRIVTGEYTTGGYYGGGGGYYEAEYEPSFLANAKQVSLVCLKVPGAPTIRKWGYAAIPLEHVELLEP